MNTELEIEVKEQTLDCWPPLIHIINKPKGTIVEGDIALCGAKLMGIEFDTSKTTCEKCLAIANGLV